MEILRLRQIGVTHRDLIVPMKGNSYYLLDLPNLEIYNKNANDLMEIIGNNTKSVKGYIK